VFATTMPQGLYGLGEAVLSFLIVGDWGVLLLVRLTSRQKCPLLSEPVCAPSGSYG
jgi:hypothetical protein